MTTDASGVAVIVLAASGRVGRELLPILANGTRTVVAVVRDHKSDLVRPDLHWMQVDVTERDLWQRSLLALSGIASIYQRTIVVDLVLDRRTVSTMRRSIADATDYARELIGAIVRRGSAPVLVAASTTAVLAPRFYQTPYGLAKRRQARIYATLPGSQIMLLPSLAPVGGGSGSDWSYRDAALTVASVVDAAARSLDLPARLWLPGTPPAPFTVRPLTARLAEAAAAHLRCFVSHRNDPWAHRRAARSRLDLTPRSLRTRIDHHLVPRRLATAFAHGAGLPVERMAALGDLHEGFCAP